MLHSHQLNLSTLAQAESLLGEVSDPHELLDRLAGKSHREVERIVAIERPVPKKPKELVRRVAVKPVKVSAPLLETPEADPTPVEERVTLRTSLSSEDFEAFEKARAIVSRKNPGATVEDALNELVGFFLKHKQPRQRKPAQSNSTRTRHIPNATRDEVMLRDMQRCTFVSRSGRRCNSTHNLQIDHIEPFALGGTHDTENLRVLCAAHNRHAARKVFGKRAVPAPELRASGTAEAVSRGPRP